jgi:hypothetical protein
MVALRLAEEYPTCRISILDAMRRRVLDNATVDDVFRSIIAEPLRKYGESCNTPSNRLPVIVIDALDECGGSLSDRRALLSHITQWAMLSRKFKLIVTSRDEDDIRRTFSPPLPLRHIFIETGNNVTDTSRRDIELYLTACFSTIANDNYLPLSWPEEAIVHDLSKRAAGVFIWASTVVKYISEDDPKGRLDFLYNKQSRLPAGDIHALYGKLLDTIFPSHLFKASRDFCSLAGALVAAQMSFTVNDLADLLEMDVTRVQDICRKLRSVLDDGELVRFAHQSFVDFLISHSITDDDTSGDISPCPERFRIDQPIADGTLVHASLRIMNARLRFNICNVPSSFLSNNQALPLDKIDFMVPRTLRYACCFVWFHLKKASPDFELDFHHVIPFLRKKLLFWLEALSCLGSVNIAAPTLAELSARISAGGKSLVVSG